MEMEWKWNGNKILIAVVASVFRRCQNFLAVISVQNFLAVSDFFLDFFSGGIPNFLAVAEFPGSHFPEFSGGSRIGANAAVFKSFPTTGSGVTGRGLCRLVEGSNPTF